MKDILENSQYISDIEKVINKIDVSMFQNKQILITGGLGLICSAVVDVIAVAHMNYNVSVNIYVADINDSLFKERYGNYNFITYLPYDATQPLDFNVYFDYIVHGAGLASPELYVTKPVETMLSNINGVSNLLKYAKSHNARKMLYISSSEVYGIKETSDPFEENRFGTININEIRSSYSEAKRASELLCKSYSSEYDVDTVVVRPGHIYGPTASPKDKRISSEFAYLAARGKPLKLKSLGLQKRSYCYSLDCAFAILIAMLNGEKGESYNIGHNQVTSIRQMAKILANAGNVELTVNEPTDEELKQFNPMNNSSLNNEKIKLIGYQDVFTVKEGLEHTVSILKSLITS